MVAYSFKSRFAEPILKGTKTQTIRAPRKRHARPGETLQLFTGMRTKQCKLIREARCIAVYDATLFLRDQLGVAYGDDAREYIEAFAQLGAGRMSDAFARADGFEDYADMRAFWAKEHSGVEVFDGVLIRWAP